MQDQSPRLVRLFVSVLVILFLVACAGNTSAPAESGGESAPAPAAADTPTPAAEAETEAATDAPASDRCGDPSQLASELHIFNWADYIDENILTQFEEECGVKVTLDIYASNEDMIAKMQAGNTGYDLIFPSDYAVQILIAANLLRPLNKDNIPNVANIKPELMGMYFDPENTYSIPYQWGTTGIAYNTTVFPEAPDSWAAIFDPALACEHKGFVLMLDDEREAIGAVLKYLGYSYNDTDPEHHAQAQEVLLAQKECLAGYTSENYIQALAAEEVVISHSWSGGTALARSENPNVAYFIPKEGGAIYMESMTIPADAPNAYTAERLINYILEPEIGAQLTNYIYYFTPNAAAEPLLSEDYKELLSSGGMMVDEEILSRLEWIKRDENSIIFSDTWTAVKAR
jgi:spermidine/putrescine transport system substrate-binding protein